VGKSTLVKAIMGFVPLHNGRILLDGVDVSNYSSFGRARLGIGVVPQGRRVFPSLTVREHLAVATRSARSTWNTDALFDLFPRLAERQRQYAGTMSGGEQQMLAIARALATDPRLLLLDEPSEGLSTMVLDSVARTIASLAATGLGILLVEQHLPLVLENADEVCVMSRGRVEFRALTDEFRDNPTVRKQYLGV
jgi:branched-chain amino acid transport system ATP-binding protein